MAKDIVAKVGSYQDSQGNTKGKYVKIGAILQGEHGEYAFIEPTVDLAGVMMLQRIDNPQKAGTAIMASIYDRNQQGSGQQQGGAPQGSGSQPAQGGAYDSFDNDVPF